MRGAFCFYADLPTPKEMGRWDEAAASIYGIEPLLLMENAAQAAYRELERLVSLHSDSRILIFAGKGNNGGDGMALARILHDKGCHVQVRVTDSPDALRSPAREHAAMARSLGVSVLEDVSDSDPDIPDEWRQPHVVVDALCGTGLKGDLRPRESNRIRLINALRNRSFVLALDIPSGLNGLTGKPMPTAVCAHATVCFEAGKPGLFFPEAREFTGEVVVRRVGVPLAIRDRIPPSWHLIQPATGALPRPSALQHKGTAGKVLIIGGSKGMAGAPVLAALGSLRAGAGLVHVAFPGALARGLCSPPQEALAHPIGESAVWTAEALEELLALMRAIVPDVAVIGPGMGRTRASRDIVAALLQDSSRPPFIVDADALTFFQAPDPDRAEPPQDCLSLRLLREQDILTPHPGELARMLPEFFWTNGALAGEAGTLGERINRIQADRPRALRAFTQACQAVLVLKGAGTLVSRRGSSVRLCPVAVSSLGVGGSGDVLAGVCASLRASAAFAEGNPKGLDSLDAACLGVYLHGKAGELLAKQSPVGHLAGDIARVLPLVWNELCER